jgi:hypothetical protein
MFVAKHLRLLILGLTSALLIPLGGCRGDEDPPGGAPGAKASAATEAGGGVTSDSPGGGNVGPAEGTKGVR